MDVLGVYPYYLATLELVADAVLSEAIATPGAYAEGLCTRVRGSEISLPDIQRPFVWSNAKVRDLFDSMSASEALIVRSASPMTSMSVLWLGAPASLR